MTKRPFHTRILISAVHNVEYLASRALDALGAGSNTELHTVHAHISDEMDPKIGAVQKARRAAAASGDLELADRLAEIERLLRPEQPRAESVLPTHRGRLAAQDELEDIRKRLLANTPRPDPTSRD